MARCEGEGLVLSRWANWAGELPEQMGLRFLRARAWVVRRALHALRHDLAWRSKLTLSLRSQEGFESAGVRAGACPSFQPTLPCQRHLSGMFIMSTRAFGVGEWTTFAFPQRVSRCVC